MCFVKKKDPDLDLRRNWDKKNQLEFIMHVPDACRLLNNKYKVPFVGKKQNSKRFPEGLKVAAVD